MHSVNTTEERDLISYDRLQEGMLCWVSNDKKYYRYENNNWIDFTVEIDNSKVENILYRVTYYQDMTNLDTSKLNYGYLCHVTNDENNNFMYYYSSNGWTSFKQNGTKVWVGREEPPDTTYLWVDTSDTFEHINDNSLLEAITNEFTVIVRNLENKINELESRIKNLENKN